MMHRQPWSATAEACLQRSGGRDLPTIRWQVENGVAQLWECASDTAHAWCVTRLDCDAVGFEWVIVLFEGRGLHEFVPVFVAAAAAKGIPLRAHLNARRRGLVRMVARYGFEPTEVVVRHAHAVRADHVKQQ